MRGILGPYLDRAIEHAEASSSSSLPRHIARLYSNHAKVAFGTDGLSSWSVEELNRDIEEAQRLLITGLSSDEETDCGRYLRRAGEMYEWCILPSDGDGRDSCIILAGTCYLLAGYPARASGVLNEHAVGSQVSKVLRLVLQGSFHDALVELTHSWVATERELDSSLALLDQMLRTMGIALAWMRWGEDPRLELALSTMGRCARALAESADGQSWLLGHAFTRIFESFRDSSIRAALRPIYDLVSDTGRRSLELYARSAFLANKSLTWPSQLAGISAIAENRSFALCTPTGSGKTRVAEILITRHLFPSEGHGSQPFILYLAPSRALSAEVEASIAEVMQSLGAYSVEVSSLYGGGDFGPSDLPTNDGRPAVLISTHEKAEALLRFLGPSLVERISCVVVDEAHTAKFNGNYEALEQARDRSLKLESLVNRLKTFCRDNVQFVALSAVAVGFRDRLASWMEGRQDASPVVIDYRSTRQLLGRLICRRRGPMTIQYDVLDGQRLTVADRDESPYIDSPFPPMPATNQSAPPDSSVGIRMRAQLLWAAINLATRTGERNQSVLISITEHIEYFAKSFLEILTRDWREIQLPDFFIEPTQESDVVAFNRCKASCADYFGPTSREYQLLERGIVLHHGKMPSIMAKLVVDLIRARVINVILATSTLSEGVNLPVETVLIPSITRRREVNGKVREVAIPPAELANLIGRAGRPGVATEGKALVLMPATGASGEVTQGYDALIKFMVEGSPANEDDGQHSPLYALVSRIYARWSQIANSQDVNQFIGWLETTSLAASVDSDRDAAEALDTLDQHILNVLEENEEAAAPLDVEDIIGRFWRKTLAQLEDEGSADTVETCLKRRAVFLKSGLYPDRTVRSAIYSTGLPPRDGLALIERLDLIKDVLLRAREYTEWDHSARMSHFRELIDLCSSIDCFRIPDMKSGKSTISWAIIFEWWMAPESAEKGPSPASVSKWYDFASKHFIFKLNWAFGSILSSLLDRDGGEGEVLERWSNAGLPWTPMWYKDMISWGVMDPVASYAMSRREAFTRHDAKRVASEFWLPDGSKGDVDLIPTGVRDWFDDRNEWPTEVGDSAWSPPANLDASLMESVTAYRGTLRVLPVEMGDDLVWLDPAGYALARSATPDTWSASGARNYDFLLDPGREQVDARLYSMG